MPEGNQGGTSISPAPPPSPNYGSAIVTPGESPTGNQGGASVSAADGGAAIATASQATVSILTGLISPADVTEARPGDRGNGATALITRRLARAESRLSKLESAQ